jgi:hypothetical protein
MTQKKVPDYPNEIDPNQYQKGKLPAHYKKPTHGPQIDTRRHDRSRTAIRAKIGK